MSLIHLVLHIVIIAAMLSGALLAPTPLIAQLAPNQSRLDLESRSEQRSRPARQNATIHWQGVALGDVIVRLRPLFPETVFIDRRIDPDQRVNLDIVAESAEQAVSALAIAHGLDVSRMGKLVYVRPADSGDLRAIAAVRSREAARLPVDHRKMLLSKKPLSWARLTQPRELVASIATQMGWQVVDGDRIPHDLWDAGELPDLTVADQLSVLLFGFGLTFELRPTERTIVVVELPTTALARSTPLARATVESRSVPPRNTRGTQQVYTLRVQEKPVGAVLRELSQRLGWAIQIDEDAIRAAGKSLDQRVSFSVENADREKLLDALLTPAGLEYVISGEQIRILPKRY